MAADSEHQCGLCGKWFDRRDLRDRHKRRCLQSYGRPKKSRRKSCLACATSKLGCDLIFPSCTRCLSRNIACNYASMLDDVQGPVSDLILNDSRPDDGLENHVATLPASEILSVDLNWNFGPGQDSRLMPGYNSTPPLTNSPYSFGDGSSLDWVSPGVANESPFPHDANMLELLASYGFQVPENVFVQTPDEPKRPVSALSTPSQMSEPPVERAGYFPTYRRSTVRRQDSGTSMTWAAASEDDHSAPGSQKRSRRSVTPPSQNRHQPRLEPLKSLGDDNDLVHMVLGYVQMMLNRGTYPPYVHSRIYNCYQGDVLEPLAKAFCCIGALKASVPSSAGFVLTLINAEREKLVKSFRDCGNSTIDTLACMHAMCVYQITGLFSSEPEQNRCAEIQHHVFLKMTRKIAASEFFISDSSASSSDPFEAVTTEADWRDWILSETTRRTIFLINIVNVLSCRTKKQDPFFFEPLFPDAENHNMISRMRVPAPETLWEAPTVEAWRFARQNLTESERKIAMMTVGSLEREGKEEAGRLTGFVRLILATLKL